MNFAELHEILPLLSIDEAFGLKILSSQQLTGRHALLHTPEENAIYELSHPDTDFHRIGQLALSFYPADVEITLISKKNKQGWTVEKQLLFEAVQSKTVEHLRYILFHANPQARSFLSLIELIAHLRAPDGCPWDRKQTHRSLRTNLLEESYEVLEAIDERDSQLLKEELGDLLLQIVLHAQIAVEKEEFNIFNVIQGIHDKIVFRHPHVFSDWDVKDALGVIKNWEILKSREREEKSGKGEQSILSSVPKSLPALSLAQKYQERAARVGFDWPDIKPVIEKIEEEILELKSTDEESERATELGDILFALVNLIRWHGLDAESLLREMNQRFLNRFQFIEKAVEAQGRRMIDLPLSELDALWDQAKLQEAKSVQNER